MDTSLAEEEFVSSSSIIDLSLSSDNTSAVIVTHQIAKEIGFSDQDQTLLAVVSSELSTNILRYAQKGKVTINTIQKNTQKGIEIIAEDNGPGIENIEMALSEHYSTGDGLGLGLPSVKRIMDEFSIQSIKNKGTIIITRKWKKNSRL